MNTMPRHIAIIMDGNRRWAKSKGMTTTEGHREGAENLKRIAKYANKIGVEYLTVYAFSTENWKRSEDEVGALMQLFRHYLNELVKAADTENIRIKIFGHTEALSKRLVQSIKNAMKKTENNTGTTLCIAFNYGGRDEIVKAVKEISEEVKLGRINTEDINESLISNYLYTKDEPDPDLLIRTSGEIRLSNFLPWQLVYTEFVFENKYWPDFSSEDLDRAIEIYEKRTRNFGGK